MNADRDLLLKIAKHAQIAWNRGWLSYKAVHMKALLLYLADVGKHEEQPQTTHKFEDNDGLVWEYEVDETGYVELLGGYPQDSMDEMAIKARCLTDYDKKRARAEENAAENLALDMGI